METENGAWHSLAESMGAWRSAFALVTFPGKEGKAPQAPYSCLFPAASSDQDECNPWCLAAHVPSFPSASISPWVPGRLSSLAKLCPGGEPGPGAVLVLSPGRAIPSSLWDSGLFAEQRAASQTRQELCVVRNEKTLAQTSEPRNLLTH